MSSCAGRESSVEHQPGVPSNNDGNYWPERRLRFASRLNISLAYSSKTALKPRGPSAPSRDVDAPCFLRLYVPAELTERVFFALMLSELEDSMLAVKWPIEVRAESILDVAKVSSRHQVTGQLCGPGPTARRCMSLAARNLRAFPDCWVHMRSSGFGILRRGCSLLHVLVSGYPNWVELECPEQTRMLLRTIGENRHY
jgi:hypothetical protein